MLKPLMIGFAIGFLMISAARVTARPQPVSGAESALGALLAAPAALLRVGAGRLAYPGLA